MAFDNSSMQFVLANHRALRRQAEDLAVRLRFDAKTVEAQAADEKAREIAEQIDRLLATAMTDWLGDSEAIVASLNQAAAGARKAIDDIKNRVETANSVASALGFFDDAIGIGKRLLGVVI